MIRSNCCIACNWPIGDLDYKIESTDTFGLCLSCCEKCVRGGRNPKQIIEAVVTYQNDPDVGGPDDPLDQEDYRDLERLGLLPDAEKGRA